MKPSIFEIILAVMVTLLLVTTQTTRVFASAEETIDTFSGKPCYRCHLSKVSGPVTHGALNGNRCTPCHKLSNGNHQIDHRFTEAKDRTARLCYECHDDQSRQKSVHPPIIDNDCFGCHALHTSRYDKLLKVPLARLCFKCHDRALVSEQQTLLTTGYRNGSRNLHYVHVRKSAIPCLACHHAHASSQDHLIRAAGRSDTSQVTLIYRATSTGGNCTSSCHGPADYARK